MSATTAYGIDLELCLGLGADTGVGRWDVAQWDVDLWGDPDTSLGDWVDVTCDVPGTFTLAAGTSDREGVVTRWEAATTAFTLDGTQYDPWNGGYAGVIGPQVAVRWRWRPTGTTGDASWLPLFYGSVTDGGYQWDPSAVAAKVTASDLTSDLVRFDGAKQAPVGAGESAAARVTRVLDNARWPADLRDVTPGGVALVATDLDAKAWDELLTVADTDLALLWIKRDGRLAYRPEGRAGAGTILAGSLVACPSGDPDAVQVIDMTRSDPSPVVNIAAVRGGTPPGGTDPAYVTVTDESSVARYRAHKSSFDLLHDVTARPDWSQTVANLVLQAQAFPAMAPRELTLGLASADLRVPLVLFQLELDHTFQVVDTGMRTWLMEVSGWDVEVGWDVCGGRLFVSDVGRWIGDQWDIGRWDEARWGLGKVS